MKAQLILENGKRFSGEMFGCEKNVAGEVIFTTSTVGYQEIITDQSYAGQIVTMAFPLIGNYGINLEDNETQRENLKALVVREKCNHPSNFRNEMNLDDFLAEKGIVGLEGIDTRALTKTIRDEGCMKAVIMQGEPTDEEVKALMDTVDNKNVIMQTTAQEVYTINEMGHPHVAFIDMGEKNGIHKDLQERGCKITVFPADVKAEDIEAVNPDMIFVSNGAGNPENAPGTVETVKSLVGKYPICGISMGHQIICMALGAKVEKLKFGHHGGNQPVKELATGKVHITSQNHNYVVTDLPENVEVTFKNVNDGSCEGIKHKELPIISIQFLPSSVKDVLDTGYLFDRFLKEVR